MTRIRESPDARGRSAGAIETSDRDEAGHRQHNAAVLRSCGATWLHLAAHGLTSEVVAAELRRILREGRP